MTTLTSFAFTLEDPPCITPKLRHVIVVVVAVVSEYVCVSNEIRLAPKGQTVKAIEKFEAKKKESIKSSLKRSKTDTKNAHAQGFPLNILQKQRPSTA